MTAPMVDLSHDASFAGGFPHATFDWLRDNDPVHWHAPTEATPDGEGFWVVSRYEDINAVFRTPELFSSDKGGDRRGGGTTLKDERAAGKILNYTDAPHHRTLRNLVNKGFNNRALAALEAELRRRANRLIDAFPEGERFDFVSHYSRELPLQAICIILGVPQEDRTMLCDWIDNGIEAEGENVVAREYLRKVADYARDIIQEKRQNPADDILSTIVHARLDEEGGRQLTDEELVNFFILLFPAGAETTRSAIGGGLRTLIVHPEQLTRLRANQTLLRTAIEEIARWTTPSIYKRRTVTRDTELCGRALRAGDKLTVWEMSANRDARIFNDPHHFDITRSPNPHLAYGKGAHICLGAGLARMELRISFETLFDRIDRFELAGPAEWTPNNRLLGLRQLPLTVAKR